jgi:hypothetical protein
VKGRVEAIWQSGLGQQAAGSRRMGAGAVTKGS